MKFHDLKKARLLERAAGTASPTFFRLGNAESLIEWREARILHAFKPRHGPLFASIMSIPPFLRIRFLFSMETRYASF
jgi:hypothetical protein